MRNSILRLVVLLLVWAAPEGAAAGNSGIRIQTLAAGVNGDNTAQAIEIRYAMDQNEWGEQTPGSGARAELAFFDAAGTEFFVFPFPSDAPSVPGSEDACGLTSVLVASSAFAALSGLTPDFTLPTAQGDVLSLLHSQAGSVCFRGSGSPGSEPAQICVSYGSPQVCEISNDCCVSDSDCGGAGDRCLLAEEDGQIPFTASVFGNQDGFTGTQTAGPAGCPAAALPLLDVVALQQPTPGASCCADEGCHSNANFALVSNPTWRNSAGDTANVALAATIEQGDALFNKGTFNGNLRSCGTCHLPEDGFGLRPESILTLHATDPLNALFASENLAAIDALENTCMMRQGDLRGLILENTLGDPPVFRSSMPLVNIEHTGPFGWTSPFGGGETLEDFAQGAVEQHTPRVLPRNVDPRNGALLSNRAATLEELALMAEFQRTMRTHVGDGLGELKGPNHGDCVGGADNGLVCGPCTGDPVSCPADQCPDGICQVGNIALNREDNLDRLIQAFQVFCPTADSLQISDGRQRFQDAGCTTCHNGVFLGGAGLFTTGIVDSPINDDTGCPIGPLPNEDQLCAAHGVCDAPMLFDVRPLVDAVRIKRGLDDPSLGSFFHDSSAGTVREAIEFYQSPESKIPVEASTPQQIADIAAFLSAVVEVGDPSICPLPIECEDISRLRAQCTSDGGAAQISTIMRNDANDGQRVLVGVNGVPIPLGIVGKFANGEVLVDPGQVVVSLLEPVGCVSNVVLAACSPPPAGACCFADDGACLDADQDICETNGGLFQGDQSACSEVVCPTAPTGACCDGPTGECSINVETSCGGTFLGDLTTCDPNFCEQPPSGACCNADGTCSISPEASCADLFAGEGTTCTPGLCPAPTGGCCFADGACGVDTESACLAVGGGFQGNATTCDPNICPQPEGACCLETGACQEHTEGVCLGLGGTFSGELTLCTPDLCPAATGACCAADFGCSELSASECNADGGTFQGDLSQCAPFVCEPAPPVSCADVQRFRARCNSVAGVDVLVALETAAQDGEMLTVSLNGVPQIATVVGRFASMTDASSSGSVTVSLDDPSGCEAPIILDCP